MDETIYETLVSGSGTRHVLDKASKPSHQARGRRTSLCGFGVLTDPPVEAVRECEFCLEELAVIRKRAELEAARVAAIAETPKSSEDSELFGADVA